MHVKGTLVLCHMLAFCINGEEGGSMCIDVAHGMYMYVCMYVCMYVWMDGWMDVRRPVHTLCIVASKFVLAQTGHSLLLKHNITLSFN